ncbi:hypothetical protein AGMMS49592_4680 [Endomicrobiia bacterium]|nr:hypothetical protein AGMMS49592_4680 [Endomicrobiia bacterium]
MISALLHGDDDAFGTIHSDFKGPVPYGGHGLRLSGKISKKIGNVEFFAGPFLDIGIYP